MAEMGEIQAPSPGARYLDKSVQPGRWGTLLYSSEVLQAGSLRHYPHSPDWNGEHETGPGLSLGFPRFPMEFRSERSNWETASAHSVFVNRPHTAFRRRRLDRSGEFTDWLRFDADAARELIQLRFPDADEHSLPCAPIEVRTSRLFALQRELHRHTHSAESPDSLFIEESAFRLLDEVLADVCSQARTGSAETSGADGMLNDAAGAAVRFISRNFRERLTAPQIARAACVSRPVLFRAFKRRTGITVHQYLTRLRLREAHYALESGADAIADLALSLGFASHAHLSAAFRREYGRQPSEIRRGIPRPR